MSAYFRVGSKQVLICSAIIIFINLRVTQCKTAHSTMSSEIFKKLKLQELLCQCINLE